MPNWPGNDLLTNHLTVVQVAKLSDLLAEFETGKLDWLSDSELVRYQSISAEQRKRQYLAGHYLIRKMAGDVFKNAAENWSYSQSEDNIRHLRFTKDSFPDLYISISHSSEWIAAAISDAPIGVDIESFSKPHNFIAIANYAFSEAEITFLKTCHPEELKQNFYLYWTLKECVAKQYGEGLKFEVARNQTPIPVSVLAEASMHSWQCPDYVLSVSSEASKHMETNGLCTDALHKLWRNMPSVV